MIPHRLGYAASFTEQCAHKRGRLLALHGVSSLQQYAGGGGSGEGGVNLGQDSQFVKWREKPMDIGTFSYLK